MAQLRRTPKSGNDWTANELCAYNITVTSETKQLHQEAAVVKFSAQLLRGLEYDDDDSIVFIRRAIPFLTCGENSVAQIDVCIMDDNEILLLLQEDKILTSMEDPEPQIIAEAIAAFALNNRKRERDPNLPLCNSIMFPCITMAGTMPVFYKITITAALSKTGTYSETETRGMRPLPSRLEILRCLEAFKKFLGK
ncbi:hypothetical protein EDB92DRAFT_1937702 [Lactarius akahatsu]|uniref:Uncharacterized protein n=1 Tax=Lactarius akahatsu TaxID=416441 RepID=A0AAD4L7K1_9AGAM|nr:hypothetical protein EDB92DRAFT_1937702 [Lactarius akahatsu]